MRISRLSRVMPALFTTISGALGKLANSASTDASLLTSSTTPRPPGDKAPSQLEIERSTLLARCSADDDCALVRQCFRNRSADTA